MIREASFEGSHNIFADIGLPDAEEHLVKAQLVYRIDAIVKIMNLEPARAADLLGVEHSDLTEMLRGNFRQFSVEDLMRFLVSLGQDIEISVKPAVPREASKGHMSVVMHDAAQSA